MSASLVPTTVPDLAQPVDPRFPNCWTMHYRHGQNAGLHKNFYHSGSLFEARERAQRHCGVMGYKFTFVTPLMPDIEVEEGIQLGTHNRDGSLVKHSAGAPR